MPVILPSAGRPVKRISDLTRSAMRNLATVVRYARQKSEFRSSACQVHGHDLYAALFASFRATSGGSLRTESLCSSRAPESSKAFGPPPVHDAAGGKPD